MFLAPTFALNYGLSFAALIASIVHTIVYHRSELWARFRLARKQEPNDIHMRLMYKYREAPDWWYAALFVLGTAFGLVTVLGYSSQLPWWAYVVIDNSSQEELADIFLSIDTSYLFWLLSSSSFPAV